MNIGSRLAPILIDLHDAVCDDCGEAVDVETYVDFEGDMLCTERHHGCMGESYRYTEFDYTIQTWAQYYRPGGVP